MKVIDRGNGRKADLYQRKLFCAYSPVEETDLLRGINLTMRKKVELMFIFNGREAVLCITGRY